MKRHVGKLFSFPVDDQIAYAICTDFDEEFGYLMAFMNVGFVIEEAIEGGVFFYSYVWLDKEIRARRINPVGRVDGFKPFTPTMRGGGNVLPSGYSLPWYIVAQGERRGVNADFEGLEALSDQRIMGLEAVVNSYKKNLSSKELFHQWSRDTRS